MIFPLALVAATVLSPLVATTLLAFGLVATASTVKRSRKPALVVNEMSRLHDELKLDARQETLWYKAEKVDWDSMGENRQCLRKQYEDVLRRLTQPGPELPPETSYVSEQDVPAARRDRWMSVYDALDAGQKETARRFFKNKLERMECFGPCNNAGI